MDAVRRSVFTYGGYDELWSDDYKLRIRYHRPREFGLSLKNGVWTPDDVVHPFTAQYLRSAATIAAAAEKCRRIEDIAEYLPSPDGLLSEELLRLLLDEHGLSMDAAMKIVVRTFGRLLCTEEDHDYLFDMQPRTAALTAVLRKELEKHIWHEPYNKACRAPVGAVKAGTVICVKACAFADAPLTLKLSIDGVSREIPMTKNGFEHVCRFSVDTVGAYEYCFVSDFAASESFRLTVFRPDFVTPDWAKGTVMYQIFPDRFGFGDCKSGIDYHRALGQTPELHESINEPLRWQARDFETDYAPDDFYGGTLNGICEKLPYLRSLGVGIIYLNPIVEARSNHRYDTSDYSKVDPILGDVEDYKALCDRAKALGIAVINDGVFSHTGADSIYFNRCGSYESVGAWQGEASPYRLWYDFGDYPCGYRAWWSFKDLPEVNEHDRTWQDFVISGDNAVVKQWLKNGASGWRLDVADELPDDVLELIRSSAKAEKSDALIIGEVWEDAVTKESYGKRRNYALGYSLDSVMNYPFRTAVADFALGRLSAFELRDFLLSQMYNYPAPMYECLMNLLGSHDVTRLHTLLSLGNDVTNLSRSEQARLNISAEESARGTALQKLCAAIQYAVPGIPCLYYGDEECLDGGRDPFNRAPFEPKLCGLYGFYAELGKLRESHDALKYGKMSIECPSDDVIMLYRSFGDEKIVCIVNRSNEPFALPFSAASLISDIPAEHLPPNTAGFYMA